jgi:Glycosyl hydrolase family 26
MERKGGQPKRSSPPRPRLAALAVVTLALLLSASAGTAGAATTTYLRPNADLSATGSWAVAGAPTAWEAMDDEVNQAQAPSSSDYIASSGASGYATVGLKTMSLAGGTAVQMTAWVFTANANEAIVDVFKSNTGSRIARGYVTAPGWNAIPLKVPFKQPDLDTAVLRIRSTLSHSQQVLAAFLAVTYDPPTPKVYWGGRMDGEVYGSSGDAPWSSATWNTFEANAGKAASMVHFGQPAPWNQPFAAQPLELTRARGAIPLMDMGSDGATLAEIASGAKDSYLVSWARAARSYGKPFFLRWDWEMNGTWFGWGQEAAASPALFASAWRHFHDVAEAQGATNVTWVWCPNTKFKGATPLGSLFPGKEYVDWTCTDGYNRGTNPIMPERWHVFSTVFSSTYAALLGLAPEKPVMIGEVASTEIGGSKAKWIADGFASLLPVKFPKIKAVSWFNWNIPADESRWDWPIESSESAQAAFSNVISSPYYASNAFGSLPSLTRIQPLP